MFSDPRNDSSPPPAYCETFHHNALRAAYRATWETAGGGRESVYLCEFCAEGLIGAQLATVAGRPRPGFRLEPWEPGAPPTPPEPRTPPLWE